MLEDKLRENLIQFINECRLRGIDETEIANRLINADWPEAEVKSALKQAGAVEKVERVFAKTHYTSQSTIPTPGQPQNSDSPPEHPPLDTSTTTTSAPIKPAVVIKPEPIITPLPERESKSDAAISHTLAAQPTVPAQQPPPSATQSVYRPVQTAPTKTAEPVAFKPLVYKEPEQPKPAITPNFAQNQTASSSAKTYSTKAYVPYRPQATPLVVPKRPVSISSPKVVGQDYLVAKKARPKIFLLRPTFWLAILLITIIAGYRVFIVDKPILGFSYYDWLWNKFYNNETGYVPSVTFSFDYKDPLTGSSGTIAVLDGGDLSDKNLRFRGQGNILHAHNDEGVSQYNGNVNGTLVLGDTSADIDASFIQEKDEFYIKPKGDVKNLEKTLSLKLKNYFDNWLKTKFQTASYFEQRPFQITRFEGFSWDNSGPRAVFSAHASQNLITAISTQENGNLKSSLETMEIGLELGLFNQRIEAITIKAKSLKLSSLSKRLESAYIPSVEIARDAQKLQDIRLIAQALEKYYNDNKAYPESVGGTPNSLVPRYLEKLPTAPVSGHFCTDYYNTYWYEAVKDPKKNKPTSYMINFCLDNPVGENLAGLARWTPKEGLKTALPCVQSSFACYKDYGSDSTHANSTAEDDFLDADLVINAQTITNPPSDSVAVPKNAIDIQTIQP